MVVTMRLVAVEGYQQVFREGILFLGIFLFFFYASFDIFYGMFKALFYDI